ncbi:YjjG family noncanonical pyrimidine nucleotidase [Lapidilactobacillus wuchangensis]|uniref:YjjG family noncanonical pyrimidine nucleotidase n=1 Tax=Lapidilactobacillus wuchangensis TaxID=2486001 RepID=UPI0013DE7084|nr:YjjG family noncanonical pyrimidine nucleotidase [Lapidilactobacillus wuchangensis]
MNYSALLFDLDKTLFDTELNAKVALTKLPVNFEFAFTDQQINYWHQLNNEMWEELENKQITTEELLANRFRLYFAHYGITTDNALYADPFEVLFAKEHALLPHAQEVLAALAPNYRLFVVSNGSRFKQFQQLAGSHLTPYFEHIFLSEDIGHSKPDPLFFNAVKQTLPEVAPAEMLVIGDSLTADIRGANLSHLDSLWLNAEHQSNHSAYQPTYEVNSLDQLPRLLNK